jgi:hypothetical protein
MLRVNSKLMAPADLATVIYPQRILVQEDMAIRAKTENILRNVRAIVAATEWPNMTGFRISACRSLESNAADLAREVVQFLDPVAHLRAADNPIDCRLLSDRSFIS